MLLFLTNNIIYSQDSYALCRVFKKTIQIPKSNKDEKVNNSTGKTEKESAAKVSESSTGTDQISRGTENEDENNFNNDYFPNKLFVSETSSSDLTQGTPTETGVADELQAPFASDNEANSAGAALYSFGVDCSSNLIEVRINCIAITYTYICLHTRVVHALNQVISRADQ